MTIKATYYNKIYAIIALVLCILQVGLILVSWLVSASTYTVGIRSILSDEGIRWLFGSFTDNIITPYIIWFVLCCMAYGALKYSNLLRTVGHLSQADYPKKLALRFVLGELIVAFIIILLLTATPNAILLNINGNLLPGSFSNSIIPYICFVACVCAVTFGLISGSLKSLQSVFHSLTVGISYTNPFWLIYILAVELYYSILFVFIQ